MSKQTIARLLDRTMLRFEEAARSFTNPYRNIDSYSEGVDNGIEIGFSKVRRVLDSTDPYNFENQHFRLGFYYASESVKKVITNDEDNLVA